MAASLNESSGRTHAGPCALGVARTRLVAGRSSGQPLCCSRLELTGGARHRAVPWPWRWSRARARGATSGRSWTPSCRNSGLSNQEGIALMCIAEALLRIPDDATADRLIAEQLATGDWSAHAGKSESLFVNASTWGLMLTGGILELDPAIKTDAAGWIRKLTRKAGEPLVRLAVRRAMRIIGGEFVVGRSIEEALARSAREPELALCSFDMLGEGARTLAGCGAVPKILRACDRRHRRHRSGAQPTRAIEHFHQAVGAGAALFAAAARARHAALGAQGACAGAPRGALTGSSSPSMPKRPIGWISPWM